MDCQGFAGYNPVSFLFHSFHEQREYYGVNGIWVETSYVTKDRFLVNPQTFMTHLLLLGCSYLKI